MHRILRNSALVLLAGLFFITAACTMGGSGEPTTNPDMVYTAAAETVQAQLTESASQNSAQNAEVAATSAVQTFQAQLSATAAAATPTNNSFQVPTISLGTSGSTQQPGQPVITFTPIVLSTMTFAPPPPSNDKFELIGQNPADNTVLVYSPGQENIFDMLWDIKNTGTTTWTQLYTIEFFLGDRIGTGDRTRYYFRQDVPPGEIAHLFVDMKIPSTPGTYYSWWKVKNEFGANFADLDVTLIVVEATAAP